MFRQGSGRDGGQVGRRGARAEIRQESGKISPKSSATRLQLSAIVPDAMGDTVTMQTSFSILEKDAEVRASRRREGGRLFNRKPTKSPVSEWRGEVPRCTPYQRTDPRFSRPLSGWCANRLASTSGAVSLARPEFPEGSHRLALSSISTTLCLHNSAQPGQAWCPLTQRTINAVQSS